MLLLVGLGAVIVGKVAGALDFVAPIFRGRGMSGRLVRRFFGEAKVVNQIKADRDKAKGKTP